MSAKIEAASTGEMTGLDLCALHEGLGPRCAVAMTRRLRFRAEKRASAVSPPMNGRGTTTLGWPS